MPESVHRKATLKTLRSIEKFAAGHSRFGQLCLHERPLIARKLGARKVRNTSGNAGKMGRLNVLGENWRKTTAKEDEAASR